MTQKMMLESYLPKIFKPRPGGYFNSAPLMIMHSATCHLNGGIPEAFTAANTELKYIHSGMTPLLQFLDVYINKAFKDQLKDQYEVWIDEGKKEYTAIGKRKRASYEDIVEWVNTTWKVVATDEVILRGFKQCGSIDCSGNTQLHSKLRASIQTINAPMEIP